MLTLCLLTGVTSATKRDYSEGLLEAGGAPWERLPRVPHTINADKEITAMPNVNLNPTQSADNKL